MTKPYGYVRADGQGVFIYGEHQFQNIQDVELIPVYTEQPQHTWVGLTPTGIEALVCAEIAARQQLGISKYGTTVADNSLPLREWLQHALEEALDQAIYLRRAIAEIDDTAGMCSQCNCYTCECEEYE